MRHSSAQVLFRCKLTPLGGGRKILRLRHGWMNFRAITLTSPSFRPELVIIRRMLLIVGTIPLKLDFRFFSRGYKLLRTKATDSLHFSPPMHLILLIACLFILIVCCYATYQHFTCISVAGVPGPEASSWLLGASSIVIDDSTFMNCPSCREYATIVWGAGRRGI